MTDYEVSAASQRATAIWQDAQFDRELDAHLAAQEDAEIARISDSQGDTQGAARQQGSYRGAAGRTTQSQGAGGTASVTITRREASTMALLSFTNIPIRV